MRCTDKEFVKKLIVQELKDYIQEKKYYNPYLDRWSYSMHVAQKLGYKHWLVQLYLKELEKNDKEFMQKYTIYY